MNIKKVIPIIKSYILQSVPLLRLLLILVLWHYIGLIRAILSYILIIQSYYFYMDKIHSCVPYSSGDRIFCFRTEDEGYNLIGYIVFEEEYDIETMKNCIIERVIKRYRKMRSIACYKNFNFWWKELPLNTVLKMNPFEEVINTYKFDHLSDFANYAYDELKSRFDIYNELPYKFVFIKSQGGNFRNLLLLKMDHIYSDGLGIIGILSGLGDNYDIKLFPGSMKKHGLNIFQIFSIILATPYITISMFYRNFIKLNTGLTPFKFKDPSKKSGLPKIALSPEYNFSTYSKINKKMGITFNDLVMSVFSSAIKKYFVRFNLPVPKRISVLIPISNRPLPVDIKNLSITNDTSAGACELILIDDVIKDCKKISNEFKKNVRNFIKAKVVKVMSDFLNVFSPYYMTEFLYFGATKGLDITESNVALPKEKLIYAGTPVKGFYPLMTTGLTNAFFGIYSYCGTFNTMISLDQNLDIDSNKLMAIFDEEMQNLLEKDKSETPKESLI